MAAVQEEMETDVEEPADEGAGGAAGDAEVPDAPNTKRRFLPSSIGITVLLLPQERRLDGDRPETPTRATPPTKSVIYAALGLPPRGDAPDSWVVQSGSQNSETPTRATPPRNRSSMLRSAYPPRGDPLDFPIPPQGACGRGRC